MPPPNRPARDDFELTASIIAADKEAAIAAAGSPRVRRDDAPDMIVLDELYKRLSNRLILNGMSMRVKKGETIAIVGSSGTGKSVTLKHMVGLMQPDSGSVIIDGEDITYKRGRHLDACRAKFGMLFQSGALIAWMTVMENVALPLYERSNLGDGAIRKRVQEVLDLVQLKGSEHKRPSQISGGMKKRAALARAIITEPKILLYDEPTSGLDPVMSRHVDAMILDMQKRLGVTSVVVTHDLHSAFTIADNVVMLHEGRVIAFAPPRQFVKSEHPFVKEFIRAQFKTGKLGGSPL